MLRRPVPVSLVLTLTCLVPAVADAGWPQDPNVNVPLSTAGTFPVSVSDGAGGAIVAWENATAGGISAQRVSAAGVPLWTVDGVALCAGVSAAQFPAIVSDGAGGAIVTWQDYRNGNNDVYAQRVNAGGVALWTANGVPLSAVSGDQLYPTIVSDGTGGAMVTWEDHRTGTNGDIYAQRVNAAGQPQCTPDGVAICTAPYDQFYPTITADGAGGAIISWSDSRTEVGTTDIYVQRVSAAGVPQWTSDGVALCSAADRQSGPTIASDGVGGAIVTWSDLRSGTESDIYVQRVNAAGVPQWMTDGMPLCTAAGDRAAPAIVSDGAEGAIVTWEDRRGATSNDVYAQRVSAAGVPQWTVDGVALCTAPGSQGAPVIISDGAGGAIVTWSDGRNNSTVPPVIPIDDIRAQRVSAGGVTRWTVDGVALCTAAGFQSGPTISADGAGGAVVAWYDFRDYPNTTGIYAQNVNADGTLGGTVVSVADPPAAAGFALNRVEPNPSVGELRASFSLSDDAPASLEVYDLSGRRIESQVLRGLGAGAHVVSLNSRGSRWAPGIYELRLAQRGRRAFLKVAIVR